MKRLKIGKFYRNKSGEIFRFEGVNPDGGARLQKYIRGFEKGPGSGWQPAMGVAIVEPRHYQFLLDTNYFKATLPPA